MTPNGLFGFAMLLACCFVEITSRPSNNESTELPEENSAKTAKAIADKEDGSIYYQTDTDIDVEEDSTKEIVEKIKAINSIINKPRRQQMNYNKPYSEKSNGIDEETLEKIKQIIASGKFNPYLNSNTNQKSYNLFDYDRNQYSKAFKAVPNAVMSNAVMPNSIAVMPYTYVMNIPVLTMPNSNEMFNKYSTLNELKSIATNEVYQTRQQQQQPLFPGFPSFPSFSFDNLFQFQPFSQLFPVLIKNPFVAFSQGGGWDNFIEYGQSADVCSRKQKSSSDYNSKYSEIDNQQDDENKNAEISDSNDIISELKTNSRQSRAMRKRTISSGPSEQEVENKKSKTIYVKKPSVVRNTTKKPPITAQTEDLKIVNDDYESLRFPFHNSGFSLFGDKKPVAPSPGFFINKLRVRKGGVAIAGPGGIATAGRGGTAIVGPGGLAYTQPGGLAIAGPHARVVAFPAHSDLSEFVSHALQQNKEPRALEPITEGKLVATGPVIYYHPTEPSTTET